MEQLILRAGVLMDGTGAQPQRDWDILLNGRKIEALGPRGSFGQELPVRDYSDKFVMPGMINCHIHLDMPPLADPMKWYQGMNYVEKTLQAESHMRDYLRTGVTYVRSLGSADSLDLKVKGAMSKGLVKGPGIVGAGRNLCMTGGHGWMMGIECDGADECRKAARTVLRDGADVVKFMATGGVMTPGIEPGSAQFNLDEMTAICEEAAKAGKRTASHAQGATGILNAVKAGVSSIEHGIFLTDEIIELMLQKGTYLVPTLVAPYNIVQNGDNPEIPDYVVRKSRQVMESHWISFQKALKAGVRIAMGTDAGTVFNPHDGTALEFRLMTDLGMSPMDALVSATKTAAELLDIDSQYGTLEAGKMADLVVLRDNPLEDITAVERVWDTYRLGERFDGCGRA